MKKQYRKATLPLTVGNEYSIWIQGLEYTTVRYVGPCFDNKDYGVFDTSQHVQYRTFSLACIEAKFTPQTLFVLFTKYKNGQSYYSSCHKDRESAERTDKVDRQHNNIDHSFITEVEVPC